MNKIKIAMLAFILAATRSLFAISSSESLEGDFIRRYKSLKYNDVLPSKDSAEPGEQENSPQDASNIETGAAASDDVDNLRTKLNESQAENKGLKEKLNKLERDLKESVDEKASKEGYNAITLQALTESSQSDKVETLNKTEFKESKERIPRLDETSKQAHQALSSLQSESMSSRKEKNLILMNAIGRTDTLPYNLYAKRHHFAEWDCIVFMYVEEAIIPEDNEDLMSLKQQGCVIIRTPGLFWGMFLQFLPPNLASQYEHIAILLDDMHLPAIGPYKLDVDSLMEKMKMYNITSISPAVAGANHRWMQPKGKEFSKKCIASLHSIETFFQIFTTKGWECYYSMFNYNGGRGWCYDVCYEKICDVKLAVDFTQVVYHLGGATPPENALNGTYLPKMQKRIRRKGEMYSDREKRMALCNKHNCTMKGRKDRSALHCSP